MLFPNGIPDISALSIPEQQELLKLVEQYSELEIRDKSRRSFIEFIKVVWPDFISGRHHKEMADAFQRVISGDCKRLIINMPPRHTKSEFASVHLPAYFLGMFPKKKIIQCSHTAELAVGFGRKVRDLVQTDSYKSIFPDLHLKSDSKAAGRWATSEGGDYFAIGVGGAVTGKGADLLIIDDPHSEQEAVMAESNPAIYDSTFDWYMSGPRQRLQPNAAIVVVMTRWSKRDVTAQILESATSKAGSDDWEVIEFPAILPSGNALWPEYWSLKELETLKSELPVSKWQAQYQQDPTSEQGAILKKEWWKEWPKDKPPECDLILCSADTAFETKQRSDYSAVTTWGVFNHPDEETGSLKPNIILLDAWRDKLTFPGLKVAMLDHYKEWEPDVFIIEGRASGKPLIYELRSMGIPISEFNPVRGNDKISRVNSIADIFSSGMVWAPTTKWADEVITECADFPAGKHDDFVDTVSQAMLRFRQGGFLQLHTDDVDDAPVRHRKKVYY